MTKIFFSWNLKIAVMKKFETRVDIRKTFLQYLLFKRSIAITCLWFSSISNSIWFFFFSFCAVVSEKRIEFCSNRDNSVSNSVEHLRYKFFIKIVISDFSFFHAFIRKRRTLWRKFSCWKSNFFTFAWLVW